MSRRLVEVTMTIVTDLPLEAISASAAQMLGQSLEQLPGAPVWAVRAVEVAAALDVRGATSLAPIQGLVRLTTGAAAAQDDDDDLDWDDPDTR